MKRIYIALGVYVALFTLGEGGLGFALARGLVDPSWRRLHVIAGLFVAIFTCLAHSLIFIHLLGTGLGVKKVIDELGLDAAPKADLYRFKMRAFPPAFLCMAIAIATAVTGGAVLAKAGDAANVHVALAVALFVANAVVFPVVARALGDNEALIRRVEREAEQRAV